MSSQNPLVKNQDTFGFLIFVIILYLLYASPLHTRFLFADETFYLLRDIPTPALFNMKTILANGIIHGRPITIFLYNVMGKFVSNYSHGLTYIRIIQFAASTTIAFSLYYFLRKRRISTKWSLFLILLIWSQPTIQVFHIYSMLTPYLLGVLCSYLAFYLSFSSKLNNRQQLLFHFFVVTFLLMVGWLTFQATPFCGLTLLSFYALTASAESWHTEKWKHVLFILALMSSMLLFVVGYRFVLSINNAQGYTLTEHSFSLLDTLSFTELLKLLHPRNYLGLFEWWNYLVPIKRLSNHRFQLFTSVSMITWWMAFGFALFIEAKKANLITIFSKYALAIFAVFLSLLPIIADNFSMRQHIYIAAVPTLILIFAYSISVIYSQLTLSQSVQTNVKILSVAILLIIGLGAQADVYRALVLPSESFMKFVEIEIGRQSDKDFEHVLVINSNHFCLREPCKGFMERRMSIADRTDFSRVFYRNMLRNKALNDDVLIEFANKIDENVDINHTIIIDHRILYSALKNE